MSFDPTNFSVKNAVKELDALSLEELEAALELEIDNKHRSSLIAEIGKKIDAVKTEAEEADAPAEEPAAAEPVSDGSITMAQFQRVPIAERRLWRCEGPDRFVKIG